MKGKEDVLDETALKFDYDNFRILLIDADSDLIINSVFEAMEAYASQSRWISVETPPTDEQIGTDFNIGNINDEWISIGYLAQDGNWYNSYDHEMPCYPTHYQHIQSLPTPPKTIK